jgi:hypothetical protein
MIPIAWSLASKTSGRARTRSGHAQDTLKATPLSWLFMHISALDEDCRPPCPSRALQIGALQNRPALSTFLGRIASAARSI